MSTTGEPTSITIEAVEGDLPKDLKNGDKDNE